MKFFLLTALALLLVSPHLVLAQTPVENDLNGTIVGSPSPAAATPTTPSPAPTTPVLSGGSGFVPLAPIPGLTQGVVANSTGTVSFLNNLYLYLIGIAAVLAVVEIIWGGLEIATKDSVSKKSDGKKRIWQALMGLALVLSPALVFGIINPAILNMSISMGPLNVQNYAGYVAPATPTYAFQAAGETQTCPDGNASACVTQLQASCRALGGNPITSGGVSANVSIQCQQNNAAVVSPGATIPSATCNKLIGHGSGGQPGLAPQQVPKNQIPNCSDSHIQQVKAAYQLQNCANLDTASGGGVCLYNQ